LPGAAFVDLDFDLASLPGAGPGRRHACPSAAEFARIALPSLHLTSRAGCSITR
jgi:hypothetical protein